MKDVTETYIHNEESSVKRPVELMKLWRDGGEYWYYTNGDVAVTYDGQSYTPATFNRSLVTADNKGTVTKCTISIGYLEDPALDYIAINPLEILWVQLMRLHRDQSPLEADVVFIGQVSSVSFRGNQASMECVGFEQFLSMTIPNLRYSINCNWQLFDSRTLGGLTIGCQLVKATYKHTSAVTVDATKTQLTAAEWDTHDDGYFTLGFVDFGDEHRAIIAHVGTVITIAYPFTTTIGANTVDAYPGCDGRIETCKTKFAASNIVNYMGFPFTPTGNPAA